MLLSPGASEAVIVPASEISAAVERTVREYAALRGLDFEIAVPHARDVEIKGSVTPVIRASLTGKTIRGISAPVRVEFLDAGGMVIRRIHLVAQVRTYAIAAVSVRDIARGDTIRVEDVLLARADVSAVQGFYTKTGDVAGTLASQALKAGTVLQSRIVKPEPLVRRGDRVTMKAAVGGVELTAPGVAREEGGRGEYIRVYNTQTRSTLVCRVIDAQTVLVGKTGG